MEKILIQIKDNIMYFKKRTNINENLKNLLNTNIISDNELVFSDDYIKNNEKIITIFLKELIEEQNIDTVYIYKNNSILEILTILKNSPKLQNIVIKDDVLITFKMVEAIKQNEHIKTFSVYSMHDCFTDYLDKNGKIVEVRNELFFTSEFIKTNELNKYSSLLYKKIINLKLPLSEEDKQDFETFIEINKYLKVIHINKCAKADLEEIINLLTLYNKKNIQIILHENIFEENLVTYIKKINTIYKKKKEISISVSYSYSYLKKNMLPQTNINILKTCIILILILVLGTFAYYIICNYIDYVNDSKLKDVIEEVIETTDTEILIEQLESESNQTVINEYIASLLTINTDIVGWINVLGTSIDYPIVLGDDNDYYLTHDIQNSYTRYGSVFMNYTNNKSFSDDNTVLFGHNFYGSSVMFSTLSNIDDESWLSDESNYIISVDTLYESLEYEIFSYYVTDVTTDYLTINYVNPLNRLDFYYMLEERSEYDFEVELDIDNKILTLSTCANSGTQRFVVHAVLID